MKTTDRLVPLLGTAAVALFWGTSGVLVKRSSLAATDIAFIRTSAGAAVLLAWSTIHRCRGDRASVAAGHRMPAMLTGLLLAAHWLTFTAALRAAPIGTVLTGVYLAPVMIAVFARRVWQERVSGRTGLALLLTAVGSLLVLRPAAAGGWSGLLLIGTAAVTYAGFILGSKRSLRVVAPRALTTFQLVVAAIGLVPMVIVLGQPATLVRASAADLLPAILLGVAYTGIALLAYLSCLHRLTVTTSGILLSLEPISSFVAGWLALDERPGVIVVFGVILALCGGSLALTAPEAVGERQSPEASRRGPGAASKGRQWQAGS